jgi:pimeloyl-ACP methyl ester carboxylesterase
MDKIKKKPVMIETRDPATREKVEVLIDHYTLQYHLAGLIGRAASLRIIPVFVARAEKGDFRQVARTAMELRRGKQNRLVMSFVMDCASAASEARLKQIADEASTTLMGDAINTASPYLCEACGDVDAGDEFRSVLKSDVPTLFISGTLDGRTAVANAEEVRVGFSNNDHLIIDGAGHSDDLFLSSPRIFDVIKAFMGEEKLPTTSIEIPTVQFVRPPK